MDFEKSFSEWLVKNLQNDFPKSVKGFSFNLFEPVGDDSVKFGIELVGAESFDENNSDWACNEIWIPEQRDLDIPLEYSGNTWEECLEKIKTLVLSKLQSNDNLAKKLKEVEGIGIGFVDGDLEIIYKA